MADIKFEEALKKLEGIVNDLEGDSIALDEALSKYEEGIKLSNLCSKKLEEARNKIEILLKNTDGSVELREFDEAKDGQDIKPRTLKKKKSKSGSSEGLF